MDYKDLILKSLSIAWKHKWLWIFGLLAGGGAGGGLGGNFNFNMPRNFQNSRVGRGPGSWSDPSMQAVLAWVRAHTALIIIIAAVIAVTSLIFAAVGILARGSLIGAAKQLDDGEETDFWTALQTGRKSFWRLLGLVFMVFLIFFLPIAAAGIILAAVLLSAGPAGAPVAILLMVPLILVMFPFFIVVGLISTLSAQALVLEGLGVRASLASGWALFRRRLGPVLLTWVINLGLGIAFGVGVMMVALVLILPLAIGGFLLLRSGFDLARLGVVVFFALAALAALMTMQAAYGAFRSVYWTLAWRRLQALDNVEEEQPG